MTRIRDYRGIPRGAGDHEPPEEPLPPEDEDAGPEDFGPPDDPAPDWPPEPECGDDVP
mgnify:CR=1 FL=1